MPASYSVKAAVHLVGINENTLRTWERRHGAVHPSRLENGRRTYTGEDIDRLRALATLVAQGQPIGQIAHLSLTKLKSLVEQVPLSQASQANIHLQALVGYLAAFDLEQLNLCLHKARFELSPREVVLNLALPLLKEVGQLVHNHKLSIAQEHLLSGLLRDHLGQIYLSLHPFSHSTSSSGCVILTTREGDNHEFGILLSAILAKLNGWRTFYLGPNMPADDLCKAITQLSADVLVLGFAPLPKTQEIVSPEEYLKKVISSTAPHLKIVVGGFLKTGDLHAIEKTRIEVMKDLPHLEETLKRQARVAQKK